ncbi:sulfite oxidase [Actibacterium mucosum KCTC 23349]|uniref:Protein-methionine-sulfoxide reductase heme-binding subunit MsrQ n=1 Tax=Actibacterium mucosum KCTC 23349 TaxID=1454373 RepID=A0A037ZN94_9RHOB|nr:sulfite oxidase [Actibacterium mucosum KCTC 23349]
MKDAINSFARKIPAWLVYVAGAGLSLWYLYLAATGEMGPEPIKPLEHALGELALQLLILGLVISPLRRFAGINLVKFRRALGLTAFFVVFAHLLVWLVLDLQSWQLIWKDIVKRPYITIGMVAFVICIPLAVTSNNYFTRRMGPAWNQLHKLTYAVIFLGGLHNVMVAKGLPLEPLIYMAVILGLLALRLIPRSRPVVAPGRVSTSINN